VLVLDFRILGPLEVVDGERVIPLGGHKQRAALAVFLLEAGRTVSTDTLIDALWGEAPPRTAATSLQNLVSQLRQLLGPETLVTTPPGYRLAVRPEQVDANRFARLLSANRGAPPAERARALRQALGLWRGSVLAELGFESFALPEITRLEELRLVALEERFEAELELGLHGELVGELESFVDEQPLRERPRGQLMLGLYRCGRQAEALAAYQDARRMLVDELGIEPSPALQDLHRAILRQERALEPSRGGMPASDHFPEVAKLLLSGRLVPVLGADVPELATRLAERFEYPQGNGFALTRVSQYVAVMRGSGPLYDELHELLDAQAAPTVLHRFFATLPPLLRERGAPHQLIVTTGYDLALEQAFLDAGEVFDVVTYVAAGPGRGKFCHLDPSGTGTLIDVPNTYASELSLERRTVILKLHGQVDRGPDRLWESFVVTEDDYIDYLARADVSSALPVGLAAKLRRSHFLFLGYSMADWNLRVILSRLWANAPLNYRSWAVQAEPNALEREFWHRRDVDVLELPLQDYVEALAREAGLAPAGAFP
jgi:DNA-binding SARP family transcriptional activator